MDLTVSNDELSMNDELARIRKDPILPTFEAQSQNLAGQS